MLLSLVALLTLRPQTVSLIPTETIWVYENASSPADGTFLRAWGVEGKSCPGEGEDMGQFSYSYLKWDLTEVPKDAKLVSATLELNNIADPGFSLESSKKAPLEARALIGQFDAKSWTYDKAVTVRPDPAKTGLFGSGYPKEIRAGVPVPISIDLTKSPSPFAKAVADALASPMHRLCLCLTSALDPSADGRSSVYKVYGQSESKESLRPTLKLTFEH